MAPILPILAALALAATAAPANPAPEPLPSPLNPAATALQTLPGVVILPGETWIFRIENGQPAGAHRAEAGARPAKGEIMVSLEGEGTSLMTVTNNSGEAYNYRAFITAKPNHKGNRTSVCTLRPGVQSFESWTDPLPAIRLADFTEAGPRDIQCS